MIRRLMMPLVRAVKTLLTAGTDVNAEDKDGWTSLHSAAFKGEAGTVEALLAAGADVNAKGKDGATPLHAAVAERQAGAVEALLAAGAKVNARAGDRLTPLEAARFGMEKTEGNVKHFQDVVRTLEAHGARKG